jgi:hypothetical protein
VGTRFQKRIFLNIFDASFPIQNKNVCKIKNGWITQGTKIPCKHKTSLYIYSRNSNNPYMRAYYIKYCKTLSRVIKGAKRQYYCRLIPISDNHVKTTWNNIKHENYISLN